MGAQFTSAAAHRVIQGIRRIEGIPSGQHTAPPRSRRPRRERRRFMLFQAPTGGVPAIDGSTLGTADCTPYYVNASGDRTEFLDKSGASQTFAVWNPFSGDSIAENTWFMCIWEFNKWIVINADCP